MQQLITDNLAIVAAIAMASLGLVVIVVVWLRRRRRSLQGVINAIAYERLSDFVIPNADEGEIHIDHLLLTAEGLLILDLKEAEGAVFGSDKMQDWTVIGKERRYTFSNPQPALYDRIAAVKQIVRQVPVQGRVLFSDGADFTKGVPALVCKLDELEKEFGDNDKTGASARIDAFKPHWELLRQSATKSLHPNARRNRANVIRS